jgi:hypothetical protein
MAGTPSGSLGCAFVTGLGMQGDEAKGERETGDRVEMMTCGDEEKETREARDTVDRQEKW